MSGPEGRYSGQAQKSLQRALSEIGRTERLEAAARQEQAGITEVLKPGFRRTGDAQLDAGLAKIWASGKEAKLLCVRINKGLSCLTRNDVVAMDWLSAEEIEAVAAELAAGKTFKEVMEEEQS